MLVPKRSSSRPSLDTFAARLAWVGLLAAVPSCGGGGGGDGGGPGPNPTTFLAGVVLDTNSFVVDGTELPVVGVQVRFLGESEVVSTDANGRFRLETPASGGKVVDFDTSGANAAPSGDGYAGFREAIQIDAGENQIARPFYLPRLATESLTTIDPAATTVVTNSSIGVSLTVLAGTARDESGELFDGQLSISEVPGALAPAALPEDLGPGLLFTVQPVGVTFDQPATLSIRNDRDNWEPGNEVNFWSLDPDLGVFAVVGVGVVAPDGSTIETLTGGVIAADWHLPAPPAAVAGMTPNDSDGDCENCCGGAGNAGGSAGDGNAGGRRRSGSGCSAGGFGNVGGWGSEVDFHNGRFREYVTLPPYISQNTVRGLEFVYASDRAFPLEVMVAAPTILASGPVPNTIGYQGGLGGVDQGFDVLLDASGLSENEDEVFRVALPLDGSDLETNVYVGQARVTSNYDATSVSGRILQDIQIVNDRSSEFGAGWRLMGLDRIYPATFGGVVLVDGQGMPRRFVEPNGSGSIVTIVATGEGGTEVTALQELLDDMGVAHQFRNTGSLVINQPEFTLNESDIEDTALFLATGTNGVGLFGFGGLNDEIKRNVLDVFESGLNQGVPLLFVGAGMGPATGQLVEEDLVRYERLTGVRRNTAEEPRGGSFGAEGLWSLRVPSHPIFNGSFGVLSPDSGASVATGLGRGSAYSPGVEQQANLGETVLVEEYQDFFSPAGGPIILNDQAVFTHSDAQSGANALTVVVPMPSQGSPPIADPIAILLKNAVEWLMGSVTSQPGRLISPVGDSSILTLNEDGSYTRELPDGYIYQFGMDGLLLSATARDGDTTEYDYDAMGLLTSVTDPVGKITTMEYVDGLLRTVTDPANRVTAFSYDSEGNLVSVSFPDNSVREFEYDARHLMTSQTNAQGFETTYEYNFAGQALSATHSDGSTRRLVPTQSIGLVSPSEAAAAGGAPMTLTRSIE